MFDYGLSRMSSVSSLQQAVNETSFSMNVSQHVRKRTTSSSGAVHFYPVGLGGSDRAKLNGVRPLIMQVYEKENTWDLKSLSTLVKDHHDEEVGLVATLHVVRES